MNVRAATVNDLPAIRDLLVETWHATYDPIYGAKRVTEITNDWHSLPSLKARLAREGAEFLVAEVDSQLAGMAFAAPGDAGQIVLFQLYVLPSHQGSGVGSRLLEDVENRFADAKSIRLEVEEANLQARRFYERKGFAQTDRSEENGSVTLRYGRELRAS
jgi:ribosomal protein S18 acetylase RimI-like enzyme